MNKPTSNRRSRWLVRLAAPLAGLALLGTGIGAAQAHDFDHHGRDNVDLHHYRAPDREHDRYRNHDRRDYGENRYHRKNRYGWRGEHRDHDRYVHRRYAHRYARDGWHERDDHDRGVFGRW